MGRQEKIGWAIALVCAVGWWLSPAKLPTKPSASSTRVPSAIQAPSSVSSQPSNMSIAHKSPDINRPKVQWLYTTAKVRVRAAPDSSAPALDTLDPGELIQSNFWDNGWYNVTVSARVGWIQGNYLTAVKPASLPSNSSVGQSPQSAKKVKPRSVRGDPVRDPYVGKCDCPYDLMADGSQCGGLSTYSRAGDGSGCYWE